MFNLQNEIPKIKNIISTPNTFAKVLFLFFDNMKYNIASEQNKTGKNHRVCHENNSNKIFCKIESRPFVGICKKRRLIPKLNMVIIGL